MMNRRAFLKSLAVGLTGLALDTRIDEILAETSHMDDGTFLRYVTLSGNLWVSNPASNVKITDIAEPIGKIGVGMKYHFHCIVCKINFHLNFMPRFCIWCGTPAKDPLPNFIDIDKLKGIAQRIHDVQGTIPKV